MPNESHNAMWGTRLVAGCFGLFLVAAILGAIMALAGCNPTEPALERRQPTPTPIIIYICPTVTVAPAVPTKPPPTAVPTSPPPVPTAQPTKQVTSVTAPTQTARPPAPIPTAVPTRTE